MDVPLIISTLRPRWANGELNLFTCGLVPESHSRHRNAKAATKFEYSDAYACPLASKKPGGRRLRGRSTCGPFSVGGTNAQRQNQSLSRSQAHRRARGVRTHILVSKIWCFAREARRGSRPILVYR